MWKRDVQTNQGLRVFRLVHGSSQQPRVWKCPRSRYYHHKSRTNKAMGARLRSQIAAMSCQIKATEKTGASNSTCSSCDGVLSLTPWLHSLLASHRKAGMSILVSIIHFRYFLLPTCHQLVCACVIFAPYTGSILTSRELAAGFVLPFASGSASAAKGLLSELCPPEQRGDALSGITLVESMATLLTQGLFGVIFAAMSEIDQPRLTFFCNAVSVFPLQETMCL